MRHEDLRHHALIQAKEAAKRWRAAAALLADEVGHLQDVLDQQQAKPDERDARKLLSAIDRIWVMEDQLDAMQRLADEALLKYRRDLMFQPGDGFWRGRATKAIDLAAKAGGVPPEGWQAIIDRGGSQS